MSAAEVASLVELAAQRLISLPERFLSKVLLPTIETDCWLWLGCRNDDGYGGFYAGPRRTVRAHRFVAEVAVGRRLLASEEVMHSCDVPACVNPEHLSVGTHGDNVRDMFRKGRAKPIGRPGEKHPMAKLTAEQARAIRSDGRTQRVIAAEYEISQSRVCLIRTGKSWVNA